jgi:microcystin-dependent protein
MRDYQTKTNVGGVPDSNTPTKVGGGEMTSLRTENKTAVARTAQTLAPQDGTGEKTDQLAKALFINGVAAQTMVDGGSAGAYQLTPITGSSGLAIPDSYSHLSGAIFEFEVANTNSGASTINIGQTAGTLLGVKDLTLSGGVAMSGGEMSGWVRVIYDLANDRFELVIQEVQAIPVGITSPWPLATPPTGWLECDGSAISRTTYAPLFAIIGTAYGVGDGSTTFNIPDYRGEFLRGWANGSTNDPDRASRTDRGDGTTGDNIGTKQGYLVQSHDHDLLANSGLGSLDTAGPDTVGFGAGGASGSTEFAGGNETRPRNVYTMFIIKY